MVMVVLFVVNLNGYLSGKAQVLIVAPVVDV